MTPVATVNIHDVVSSSLCGWITESLEQFGVDSRVFLRVIQSVLEQDIQSLRGEDRLNDLWSYRIESIGSKRKHMSKEDLLRRVLLENMKPCFKEDELFIAEEFVDELLSRWNEEVKMKEIGRNNREGARFLPDGGEELKVEDTRDPVTLYNEAFPALVSPQIAISSELDAVVNSAIHGRQPCALQRKWRENHSEKWQNYPFRRGIGYRSISGRYIGRCLDTGQTLGNLTPHGWTDPNASFGVARGFVHDDTNRQFSVGNSEAQNASYQGSVFDKFLAQIIKSNVQERVGSYATSRGPRFNRYSMQAPFAPMPAGFLHRTIEKILSQSVTNDSVYEPAFVVGDESHGHVPDVTEKHNLPIYMENECGVLVCVSDDYGLYGGKNFESPDSGRMPAAHFSFKGGYSVGGNSDVDLPPSGRCISGGHEVGSSRAPTVYRRPYPQFQSEPQRTRCFSPSCWVHLDSNFIGSGSNVHSLNADSEKCGVSLTSLRPMDANSEVYDAPRNYDPEYDALPGYDCHSSVLGNFAEESAPYSWRKVPNCIFTLPAELNCVPRDTEAERLDQIENSLFSDSSSTCICTDAYSTGVGETAVLSATRPSERSSVSHRVTGDFGVPHRHHHQAVRPSCGTGGNERTLESIANLVAEISERDLMNHLAASLSFLFPDVLMPQPLYLPEDEMLACSDVCIFANLEPRYNRSEVYPYNYWQYLYSALSRGDVDVDQILNYGDFHRWSRCKLNQWYSSGAIACICGLCCRGVGYISGVDDLSAESEDGTAEMFLPNRSLESSSELCVADSCSDSLASLKTALAADEEFVDTLDKSLDVYKFVFDNSCLQKDQSVVRFGDEFISSQDGREDESFIADWSKIKALWSDKDVSSAYTIQGASIFFRQFYEENNNKFVESSNLFPCGSHWVGHGVETRFEDDDSVSGDVISPSVLSVDVNYDAFSGTNEKLENELIISMSSLDFELDAVKSSSSSSATFSRLLSSEDETSRDDCHAALEDDIYSPWLSASLCRSCKTCCDTCRQSSTSSGPMSSECVSPVLDSGDAGQCTGVLWSIDDAGSLSESLQTDASSSSSERTRFTQKTEDYIKAFDESTRLSGEGTEVSDDSITCILGNSPQKVPYQCNSSVSGDGDIDSDNSSSSLSFLSANYSDGSELCESDFGSSEPASGDSADVDAVRNMLAEGTPSDSGSEQLERENGKCGTLMSDGKPESVRVLNIGIDGSMPESFYKPHDLYMPGVTLPGNLAHLESPAKDGFENFERLKILWDDPTLPGADHPESGSDGFKDAMFGCFVNTADLERKNDEAPFQETVKSESDESEKLEDIYGQNYEDVDLDSLGYQKSVLDRDVLDHMMVEESLDESGLEKIKKVRVLWDCDQPSCENIDTEKKSTLDAEKVIADKFSSLEVIWSQPSFESSNLEQASSLWHSQDVDSTDRLPRNRDVELEHTIHCTASNEIHENSEWQSGKDIILQDFQESASIWGKIEPSFENVLNIGPNLNIGSPHVTEADCISNNKNISFGSEFSSNLLNPFPSCPSVGNLMSSKVCCNAADDEAYRLEALKSIWEDSQLILDGVPHTSSCQTDFVTGISQENEGSFAGFDDAGNFEHLRSIWEKPTTAEDFLKIHVFSDQPSSAGSEFFPDPNIVVEPIMESIKEHQNSFKPSNALKMFAGNVDLEEQNDLETNKELALIWEKKKSRTANLKASEENCPPPALTKSKSGLDLDHAAEEISITCDDGETGNLMDLEILGRGRASISWEDDCCQHIVDSNGYEVEKSAKNIEQLKAIWDEDGPTLENGSDLTCWGVAPSGNVSEKLPEWDLRQVANTEYAEKSSIWSNSESSSHSSGSAPSFWNDLELLPENLNEVDAAGAVPVATANFDDNGGLIELKHLWNDDLTKVDEANSSMTNWVEIESTDETLNQLPREVLSDFDKTLSDYEDIQEERFRLNEENEMRLLWKDVDAPKTESLKRVASLSCWEHRDPVSESLRRIASESLWEPLGRNPENSSYVDAEFCAEQKTSSSDSLKHAGVEFGWENDALVIDGLKERTLASPCSHQCQNSGALPETMPSWRSAPMNAEYLRSCRSDSAFDEKFEELQSIWQACQSRGENFNCIPEVLNYQDTGTEFNGGRIDSQFIRVSFDPACRQLTDAAERSINEKTKYNSELFLGSDRAGGHLDYLQETDDRKNWLCSGSDDFGGVTAGVDVWATGADDLKCLISGFGRHHLESRGFRGLFADVGLKHHNLANEWQLAEAFSFLRNNDPVVSADSGLLHLFRQNQNNTPKLVPSENTAFRDKIPHRFAYRYSFFDPQDARRDNSGSARIETIKHIYDPSHSIMRQLEDVFDDGQRLHSEESLRILPNHVFRPIGDHNSGRDSYHSGGTSVCGGAELGDLILQVRTPIPDPNDLLGPDSPYQLYFGADSKSFVPRFRVHKELEKSAQTGEATPPMQNNDSICNMNVILSTMALLD